MKTLYSSVLAVSMLLASAGASQAASQMNTPLIPGFLAGAGGNVCQAVNIGTKGTTVTVEILDASTGNVIATSGPATVAPMTIVYTSTLNTVVPVYCRVNGLSSKSGRATFFSVDGTNHVLMSVTAP